MKWIFITHLSLLSLTAALRNSCNGDATAGYMRCDLNVDSDKPVEYEKSILTMPGGCFQASCREDNLISLEIFLQGSLGNKSLSSLMPSFEEVTLIRPSITYVGKGGLCSFLKMKALKIDYPRNFPNITGSMFYGCNNLRYLELEDVNMEPDTFEHLSELEELNIIKQNISHLTRDYFEPLLNLRRVTFSRCYIEKIDPGVLCLPPKLEQLVVTNNKALPRLTKEILSNCGHIRHLNLNKNGDLQIDQDAFTGLESDTNSTKSLILDYIDILHLSSKHIKGFNNVNILQVINKADTWIDEEFFLSFPNLEKLSFERNSLSSFDSSILPLLPNLNELNLNSNHIRNVDNIVHATLEDLKLSHNEISKIDSSIMKENLPNLKKLDIGCSGLDSKSVDALKQELDGVIINTYCHSSSRFNYA